MFELRRRAAALGLLLLAALAAGPAAAVPLGYGGLYAFGDSLTDNGNAYRWSGGRTPKSPPYWKGRFADGPNWYDRVAAAFRAEGAETRNYAVGGATAITRDIHDLQNQRRLFQISITPKRNSIAAVGAGANDVMNSLGRSDLTSVARKAADEVVRAVNSLMSNRVKSALVLNLADLGKIPRYANRDAATREAATRGAMAFNNRLAIGLAGLRAKGMTIHEVDVFGYFNEVWADPLAFGIDNLTRPCLIDNKAVCTAAEMARSAFADRTHPSATLHAILASRVLDLLRGEGDTMGAAAFSAFSDGFAAEPAAVPLPLPVALLLAGIGGLVLVRLRAA
jgi:outer membrane lipase/esterase